MGRGGIGGADCTGAGSGGDGGYLECRGEVSYYQRLVGGVGSHYA